MGTCRACLNSAIGEIESSGIRDALSKASSIPGIISLAIGDPDLPIPDIVKFWMRNGIGENITRYTPTEGFSELRVKILEKYRGYDFAESSIVTAGVSGAIDLLCRVLFERGQSVVVLEPYFPMYKSQLCYVGATPLIIPMAPDFHVDFGAVERAVAGGAVAIFVNSPNNPTGRVYSQGEIEDIAQIANKYGILVISDEIYDCLSYDVEIPNFYGLVENLIVLNGWAKNYSLTGSRIGYAVGPKWVIEAMAKAQMYTYVCANTVAQWAVLKSWDETEEDLSRRKQIFRERRDLVWKTLRPHFALPKPEGAFYAFVQAPPVVTGKEFAEACLKQNVLVVPSGGVFTEKDCFVRISYALPTDKLKVALKGMIEAKQTLVK
jgi:aminotransferase